LFLFRALERESKDRRLLRQSPASGTWMFGSLRFAPLKLMAISLYARLDVDALRAAGFDDRERS